MARVKLKFPDEKPLFETTIPVRVGDLNYADHVGNDSILSIIHESRMQFLRSNGYNELDIGGVALIMADVMIAYRGESFYGDTLKVAIYAEEITTHSFDLLYRISTRRSEMEIEIAHAKTGMVCFDYSERKIAHMSIQLRELLRSTDRT